jgi:hypothetical protein
MIITKRYANQLIRAGKARLKPGGYDALVFNDGKVFTAIERLDIQRTDLYQSKVKLIRK